MPSACFRAGLAAGCLALVAAAARADEGVPSFRSGKDRETKEFVGKVAAAIVKAARAKPQRIEVDRYEYVKGDKPGRRELRMKVTYHGLVTKKKYTADVVVFLDASDSMWEVLNVTYKDTNPSPTKPNVRAIQDLIPKFKK